MKYKFTDSTDEEVSSTKQTTTIKKTNSSAEKIEKKGKNTLERKGALISDIDQSLNGIVNKRIMKLVKIGLKHELTIENMMQYFREVNKTKLYELKRYFSDSQLSDISNMLQYLFKSGALTRDVNNWYSLNSK